MSRAPITDLGKWRPPVKQTMTDGELRFEKLPPSRHIKMLDTAGNVKRVPFYNGMANKSPTDPYMLYKRQAKLKAGWIPWGKCPQVLDANSLPPEVRGRVQCTVAADGNPIGADHPCACNLEIQAIRVAKNNAEMEKLEERHRSKSQRDAEQRERQIVAQEDTQKVLADALSQLLDRSKDADERITRKGKKNE